MTLLIIILASLSIIITLIILYFVGYNKIAVIKTKMDNSSNLIKEKLDEKYEVMNKLYLIIKKVIKKKDYLKDFTSLKNKNLSVYEFDKSLIEYFSTMLKLKEDYKEINTNDAKALYKEIKQIDQNIIANKKYFNKNNNILMKELKGYIKIIAKINKINVKTSFETKEPTN